MSDFASEWETIQRVVFSDDSSVEPLYVRSGQAGDTRFGRFEARISPGRGFSTATYFNAFPASHWCHSTDVENVRLAVVVVGEATVVIKRSSSIGEVETLESGSSPAGRGETVLEFKVSLASMDAGGWLWFEIVAGHGGATMRRAEWQARGRRPFAHALSVVMPTYNNADECLSQLRRLGGDEDLIQALDEVFVIDQGDQHVEDLRGYPEVARPFGPRLRVIRQANLGGAGGFARGMLEAARRAACTHVLLLDDDATPETESIRRLLQFSLRSRRPLIVGGQMLDLGRPTHVNSFGERVGQRSFWWGPVDPALVDVDMAAHRLDSAADSQLHTRLGVDFNGWWMCMIPVATIRHIGLPMPVFIKWDDAEYGLRAAEAGIVTVTLPGAAVWHRQWADKGDALGWQAYFLQRNRWVAALAHLRGGPPVALFLHSLALDVKQVICMQYSAAVLRGQALADVLHGPGALFPALAGKRAQMERLRRRYPDSRPVRLPREDGAPTSPVSRPGTRLGSAIRLLGVIRVQLFRGRAPAPGPAVRIPLEEAKWWNLGVLDSAVVELSDGNGIVLRRRRRAAWRLLRRTLRQHLRLWLAWRSLSRRYRTAVPELTSPAAWQAVFAAGGETRS